MSGTKEARYRAGILVVAPAVLMAGLIYHPHLPGPLPNDAAIASAASGDTTRWAVAHLAAAIGSGLLAVAFLALRDRLREAGEDRWSGMGLPFIVLGSTLYALLPALEFAPLAAALTGGDVAGAQAALTPVFLPLLLGGSAIFAVGVAGFAVGIVHSRLLTPQLTRVVVVALVVTALARFVPFAEAQLYLQSAAIVVALWPLAYWMWGESEASRAKREQTIAAT